jgi:hypothetical protein
MSEGLVLLAALGLVAAGVGCAYVLFGRTVGRSN